MDRVGEHAYSTRRENQFAAATRSADLAIQSLLILNGGACVALLGVLAAVSANREASQLLGIISSAILVLQRFSIGAGLAVLAAICAYVSNYSYAEAIAAPRRWQRCGIAFQCLALAFCCASISAFVWGVWEMHPFAMAGSPAICP